MKTFIMFFLMSMLIIIIKKKKRIFFLKKLKLKNKLVLRRVLNSVYEFDLKYYCIILLCKLIFLNNFFNENYIFEQVLKIYSYMYSFNNNFLKRFKRKKRFKRLFVKNNLGKKFTFFKVLNSIEYKKKKKRK